MNCEANGCTAALTPKPLPGSAMGGPSPWVVTDIPPGWCVRQVENTDVGSSRVVVLCPLHGAGVIKVTGVESVTVTRGEGGLVAALVRLRDEPPVARPAPPASRLEVLREVALQLANCIDLKEVGEYQRELAAEIGAAP